MNIRELTQADIDAVKDNSTSRGILYKQPDVIDFNYALEHEGKILCIGGIKLINETTAWAWVDLNHESGKHIIAVYRVIKEWCEILCKEKKIIRLQCYVEEGFVEGKKLVEHLGFRCEFIMPCFVGNKPAYLYSKFYGE